MYIFSAADIIELKILKNPAEATSVVKVQATPSKLSPENNDLENFCPSPVKVCEIPDCNGYKQVPTQNGYKQNGGLSNHNNNNNNSNHSNGNSRYTPTNCVSRNRSSPTYGNNSPRYNNGTNSPRYSNNASNGHSNRYTPTNENGATTKNVRFTPTRDESASGIRPRRNSSEYSVGVLI